MLEPGCVSGAQWSVGFGFRLFNIIHDYVRKGCCIETDFSLPAVRVIRAL